MDYVIRRGKQSDYYSIINCANTAFLEDFSVLVPKIYALHPEQAENHIVAEYDGKIVGLLCFYIFDVDCNGSIIKVASIGTVCVKEIHRNRGIMGKMLTEAERVLRSENVDIICLDGKRQRYEHYGYRKAAMQLHYNVTSHNVNYSLTKDAGTKLLPLTERLIPECKAMYDASVMHTVRSAETFMETLYNWNGEAFGIFNSQNKLIGYASILKNSNEVQEIVIKDGEEVSSAIAAVCAFSGKDCLFNVYPHQHAIIDELERISENCVIETREMVNILNYKQVIKGLLSYKNALSPLIDGELIISCDNKGMFKITVNNGNISVEPTGEAPDLIFENISSELISPIGILRHNSLPASAWFPMPLPLYRIDVI